MALRSAGSLLLGFALGGCTLDALGLGDGGMQDSDGSTTAATAGSTTDATSTSDPSVGTDHGSGALDSSGTTTTVGSTATGETGPDPSSSSGDPAAGSSTGDPPEPLCAHPDLAACYDFAGVGGGMLWDLSGNGNHAPAVAVGVVPGPFGEAATFDGSSQIAVPDSPSLDIAESMSLEAWVRVDALPRFGRVGVLDNDEQYAITIHADGQYRCALADANLFTGQVTVGQWTHVACVYDHDGGEVRFFVDGALVGTAGATNTVGTGNGEPMSIGDTSPAFEEPLTGAIGALRVWNTDLTVAQVCEAAGEACRR